MAECIISKTKGNNFLRPCRYNTHIYAFVNRVILTKINNFFKPATSKSFKKKLLRHMIKEGHTEAIWIMPRMNHIAIAQNKPVGTNIVDNLFNLPIFS